MLDLDILKEILDEIESDFKDCPDEQFIEILNFIKHDFLDE